MHDGAGVAERADGSRLAEARVLVAEAEAVIALDLERTLQGFGCAVLGPVAAVADALRLLERERPDAALLELGLRDGHAAPLAEALARLGVPFALVTSHNRGEHEEQPVLRAAPRVPKPYRRGELDRILGRLLDPGVREAGAGDRVSVGQEQRQMDILAKVPTMPDDALGNLHANAERLRRAGSQAQRSEAAALLPALEAELAARRAAKLGRAAQARREASALRADRREARVEAPVPAG